jgi:hypothetical protein
LLQRLLRGAEAQRRIVAEEREIAERGVDGAAQAIVDPHLLERILRGLAERRAADGIEDLEADAAGLGDDELMLGRGVERAVGQRLQHAHGARVARRAQGFDRLDLGGEIVRGELLHQLFETGGPRERRQGHEREKRQ